MDHLRVRSGGVTETLTAPANAPGSWERFESLYRSSRDDVYAYVCTLLRDPAAAEDVTALAFERAYRRRRTFDRRRGEERAWLFGIARNAALDELRRRGGWPRWSGSPRTSTRCPTTTAPRWRSGAPRCKPRWPGCPPASARSSR